MKRDQFIRGFRKIFTVLATAIALICLAGQFFEAYGQADRRLIREGNRLYQKEQFDESELSYRRALENDSDSPQARFNLGNALFKQERYDESQRFFSDLAGEIDDPVNRAKVFHNLGNSLLMSDQVEQSIEAYKEALRNNPYDSETRYNLAYAQHLLDQSEDQEEGDDQDQGNDDDSEQGDEDNEQGGDKNDQGDEQENDDGNRDQDRQDDREEEREGQPEPRPDQITPEDAMRMLEAADREEQRVQQKLMGLWIRFFNT